MAGKTKVAKFLKSRGSSQNEAAKVIGKSMTAFSLKANGRSQFTVGEIRELADYYDMTSEEIIEVFL